MQLTIAIDDQSAVARQALLRLELSVKLRILSLASFVACGYPALPQLSSDAPTGLVVVASPSSFVVHVNNTRRVAITVTNHGAPTTSAPQLQATGLDLGAMTFTAGTCTSGLATGESCTATASLTATALGQTSFQVGATSTSAMPGMTTLSLVVRPACAASCGPSGTSDCCASAIVPGNAAGGALAGDSFYRSYDLVSGTPYPQVAANAATVSDFRLDNYVVTVGRFRAFVDAGMGTSTTAPPAGAGAHDKIPGSGWDSSWNTNLAVDTATLQCDAAHQTWTASAGSKESLPMNCLNWYEAFAFCIWDGGYLPTEAEWNYAAAGGSDQRAYPWSSPASSATIDCTYADYDINTPTGTFCVNGTTGGTDRVGSQSPKGDGRWGQSDLAGNVWQWAFDWYGTSYPSPCNDCAGLTQQAPYGRALRGGSYGATSDELKVGFRFKNQPGGMRFADQGVRCARTP